MGGIRGPVGHRRLGGRGVGGAGLGCQRLGGRVAVDLYSCVLIVSSTSSGMAPRVVHLGVLLIPLGRIIHPLCQTRERVAWVRVWGL